jgi:hypothetical protein
MKYSDELEIDGRTYRIAGASGAAAGGGCELTVRADDVGAGAVEVRVAAPAAELDVGQLAAEPGRKPRPILSRLVKHGVVAQR